MSKRDSKGTVIEPSSSRHQLGDVCLPLSSKQLREIWSYDFKCASELMGAPHRTCTCEESNDKSLDTNGSFTESDMTNLKVVIRSMWEKAASMFEVFSDPNCPELGHRLKVKNNMPIKVTFRAEDGFFFGWCATAPEDGPCSHLYRRSPVEPCGYMGGPASFLNWAGDKKQCTASLTRPTTRLSRYLVRLECRNLSSGAELTWNYGCSRKMPTLGDWFQDECCSVIINPEHSLQRQQRKSILVPFMNTECCTLCGDPFACDNKERKLQRKPHYINSHADFLGSQWDGLDTYKGEEVDGKHVLQEADKLNRILNVLTKNLSWSILPACNVLTANEEAGFGDNSEALLEEFKKRITMLRSYGMFVLRGGDMILANTPTTVQHLQPIPQSVWKSLKWKKGTKPKSGSYGVPKSLKADHNVSVQAALTEYCMKNCQP